MSNEILKRLVEIKKEIGHLKKESKGVHGSLCRSIYDTYLATHDPFGKHGILSSCEGLENGNMKWTFYCAEDGSTFSTTIPMVNTIDSFFDAGNAISYSHKYAITSMLGLPDQAVNQSDPDVPPEENEKQSPPPVSPKTSTERIDENRSVKPGATDKSRLYQKMLDYKIKPDYHTQIYLWIFDDAKSGEQTIGQLAKDMGVSKFRELVLKFADKAKQEDNNETIRN